MSVESKIFWINKIHIEISLDMMIAWNSKEEIEAKTKKSLEDMHMWVETELANNPKDTSEEYIRLLNKWVLNYKGKIQKKTKDSLLTVKDDVIQNTNEKIDKEKAKVIFWETEYQYAKQILKWTYEIDNIFNWKSLEYIKMYLDYLHHLNKFEEWKKSVYKFLLDTEKYIEKHYEKTVLYNNPDYWIIKSIINQWYLFHKAKKKSPIFSAFAPWWSYGTYYLWYLDREKKEWKYPDIIIGSSAWWFYPTLYELYRMAKLENPEDTNESILSLLDLVPDWLENKSMFFDWWELINSFKVTAQKLIDIINKKRQNNKIPNINELKFSDLERAIWVVASRKKPDGKLQEVLFSKNDLVLQSVQASSNPHLWTILWIDINWLKETYFYDNFWYDWFHTNPIPIEYSYWFNVKINNLVEIFPSNDTKVDEILYLYARPVNVISPNTYWKYFSPWSVESQWVWFDKENAKVWIDIWNMPLHNIKDFLDYISYIENKDESQSIKDKKINIILRMFWWNIDNLLNRLTKAPSNEEMLWLLNLLSKYEDLITNDVKKDVLLKISEHALDYQLNYSPEIYKILLPYCFEITKKEKRPAYYTSYTFINYIVSWLTIDKFIELYKKWQFQMEIFWDIEFKKVLDSSHLGYLHDNLLPQVFSSRENYLKVNKKKNVDEEFKSFSFSDINKFPWFEAITFWSFQLSKFLEHQNVDDVVTKYQEIIKDSWVLDFIDNWFDINDIDKAQDKMFTIKVLLNFFEMFTFDSQRAFYEIFMQRLYGTNIWKQFFQGLNDFFKKQKNILSTQNFESKDNKSNSEDPDELDIREKIADLNNSLEVSEKRFLGIIEKWNIRLP